MSTYNDVRQQYKPEMITYLLIAESPPPAAGVTSSRQFYRAEYQKADDRLYAYTMRAVFPEADTLESKELEADKEAWLRRFAEAGCYMIEALGTSLQHEVTKKERQALLAEHQGELIERVAKLVTADTKLILIKSNVFVVLAEPLGAAGFTVLNRQLLDYPGRFNTRDYREKLAAMVGVRK